MTLAGRLALRDGALFIVYETTLDSEPTLKRLWWRVEHTKGEPYSGRTPLAGDTCTSSGNNWHCSREGCGLTGSVYAAGNREAEIVEFEPVPRPKVRKGIETRWHYGKWEKLTKKGWVPV